MTGYEEIARALTEEQRAACHVPVAPVARGRERCSAQLPPLAADLEGLAVSLGILAGNVTPDQWEFVKRFRDNLRAAAERVAALETGLEAPHEQA